MQNHFCFKYCQMFDEIIYSDDFPNGIFCMLFTIEFVGCRQERFLHFSTESTTLIGVLKAYYCPLFNVDVGMEKPFKPDKINDPVKSRIQQ